MPKQIVNIRNKKAGFEYELTNKFVAGVSLKGTEIKSIRKNQVSMSDSYCKFLENELWIENLHISEYDHAGHENHEPKRSRKLLLNRQELDKIHSNVRTKGLTIIPTRLFINDKGIAKIEIAIAKGKKIHDKRESLKEKENKRNLDKIKKNLK